MTWYYSPSSPSVPVLAVSTSECMTLWADALAQSATWNTKPLPAKSWLRVLRTVPWMTRRFGQTSTPSMVALSAERWLASLEAIPVSRFQLPGSDSEPQTRATSGRQSAESSVSASRIGASSKTWLDTFDSDIGTLFAQTSSALATGSRKASSRRRKSAPHTAGSGSSSWPTARSEDSESAGNHPGATDSLTGATAMWPTPDAPGQTGGPRNRHESRGQGHNVSLGETAEYWITPSANEDAAGTVDGQMQQMLTHQAKRFHQDPGTAPHGHESSPNAPTSRRQLNPRFVEWLQGWRPGWTSLAPLDYDSPETASFLNAPASPSAPSGDNWPTPDTQNARDGTMRTEASKEADGKHAISLHHAVARWEL